MIYTKFIEYKKLKRKTSRVSETFVLEMFFGSKLVHRKSHDVKLKGMRFEVKGATPHVNGGYLFNLDKKYQHRWGDYFVFVTFNKSFEVQDMYLVPRVVLVGKKHIWIGKKNPIEDYKI